MDNELFELCREVYEKCPEWNDTDKCVWNNQVSEPDPETVKWAQDDNYSGYHPLYTSDYLLEKLRNYDFTIINLNSDTLSLTSDSLDGQEAAILGKNLAVLLLEFAIALYEEGELK